MPGQNAPADSSRLVRAAAAEATSSAPRVSTRESEPSPGSLARAVLFALSGYKTLVSPWFAGSCRFTPSCADYTAEAVRRYGSFSGLILGLRRLARCRPLGAWGFDPVPERLPRRVMIAGRRGPSGCAVRPSSRQSREKVL
jgi:putative membrane protein insertion efficiency factor